MIVCIIFMFKVKSKEDQKLYSLTSAGTAMPTFTGSYNFLNACELHSAPVHIIQQKYIYITNISRICIEPVCFLLHRAAMIESWLVKLQCCICHLNSEASI